MPHTVVPDTINFYLFAPEIQYPHQHFADVAAHMNADNAVVDFVAAVDLTSAPDTKG